MAFGGLSYWAVLAAAIASFVFGAFWYGLLGKQWMDALGKTKDELMGPGGKPPIAPMVISLVAELIMAWVLAGLIGHLGPGRVTPLNGLISGAFVWLGFVATTLTVNHGYQRSKPSLTLIDGAHWLGVLVIQGLVIGLFGGR
jgi:Protein of unknown function (DUF1761)